jgi:hypothetical protein
MSYFEEGNKKGFYVLDLPNLFVPSKGYFAGASAIPFNYQGNTNSTSANFSWNDPTLPLNYGYLKKWVATGNTANDGNKNYDEETLPANFNDFFSRRSGNGATYNAFIFKNGTLVNSFFGGTGGDNSMPKFITDMPVFKLEIVTAAQTKTSTISFNSFKSKPIEYVTQDIGNDNGFIKTRDGYCGTWTKSSADAFHTPGVTNSTSGAAPTGSLTIDAHLYNGANLSDPSFAVYNITAGEGIQFPVELQVYMDNGTTPGILDMNDQFVAINTENSLSDGAFTTTLPSKNNILIIAKTNAGCIDQIVYLNNPMAESITLPIKLLSFQGNTSNNNNVLNWVVDDNETGVYFEIQRSVDGKNFKSTGFVSTTGKKGQEQYSFSETADQSIVYYRLKVRNKNESIAYSSILVMRSSIAAGNSLRILQNPVEHTLNVSHQSSKEESVAITVYNTLGVAIMKTKVIMHAGQNTLSFDATRMAKGSYILEVVSNTNRSTARFIK